MATATLDTPKMGWRPNPGGQRAFLACPFWEALTDGNRGSGKSAALIVGFLAHIGRGFGPDWRGVIFRVSYPELDDIIAKSKAIIYECYPNARYNESTHTWKFPDGEQLLFRHLENLKAYSSYHGQSFPYIGFDELSSWGTDEAYVAILSCSRPTSSRPDMPLLVRSTTNSWGPGFQWIKSRFVQGKRPYEPYGEPGRERIRIPIMWHENKEFVEADPLYHLRLADILSNEAQRMSWLHGSWDYIGGGRFAESWSERDHVMEPFNVPERWRVDRSHDWGSAVPFCSLWFCESNGERIDDGRSWPRGTIFVISEDYGCQGDPQMPGWKPNVGVGLGPVEIAQRTRQNETRMREWGLIARQPAPGPGDDPLFDTTRGRSMASVMAELGVVWNKPSKGPGSRITGWQLLEDRLKASRKHPMERPGLFIFSSCQHLIRTIPLAMMDPKKPEDIDLAEDHALDALRLRLLAYGSGSPVRGVSL